MLPLRHVNFVITTGECSALWDVLNDPENVKILAAMAPDSVAQDNLLCALDEVKKAVKLHVSATREF